MRFYENLYEKQEMVGVFEVVVCTRHKIIVSLRTKSQIQ